MSFILWFYRDFCSASQGQRPGHSCKAGISVSLVFLLCPCEFPTQFWSQEWKDLSAKGILKTGIVLLLSHLQKAEHIAQHQFNRSVNAWAPTVCNVPTILVVGTWQFYIKAWVCKTLVRLSSSLSSLQRINLKMITGGQESLPVAAVWHSRTGSTKQLYITTFSAFLRKTHAYKEPFFISPIFHISIIS